jgi:hypothetical protein
MTKAEAGSTLVSILFQANISTSGQVTALLLGFAEAVDGGREEVEDLNWDAGVVFVRDFVAEANRHRMGTTT